MVGLGILTSLVDGVSFGSMRIRHFTGSMEEPVLPQNFMAACFITGCILCFAFVLHLYCTILVEENYA